MAIRKVVLSGVSLGQLVQNRMYVSDPDGFMDLREIAIYFRDNWFPHYRKLMLEDVRWVDISVSTTGQPNVLVHHEPVSIGGGQLTEPVKIPFACAVIRLHTGIAGRKFRGRIYSPLPRGGDYTNGFLSPQGVVLANQVLDPLRNLFAKVGPNPGPLQLVIHGEPEPHDTPVVDMVMSTTMGVQRRRNVGVGQ